ncbi:MAG: hypothetical protein JWL99_1969 [Streptomyces oryziradicis]|nr:hypothetical protein [Actinacidiphila oryziradicis]
MPSGGSGAGRRSRGRGCGGRRGCRRWCVPALLQRPLLLAGATVSVVASWCSQCHLQIPTYRHGACFRRRLFRYARQSAALPPVVPSSSVPKVRLLFGGHGPYVEDRRYWPVPDAQSRDTELLENRPAAQPAHGACWGPPSLDGGSRHHLRTVRRPPLAPPRTPRPPRRPAPRRHGSCPGAPA